MNEHVRALIEPACGQARSAVAAVTHAFSLVLDPHRKVSHRVFARRIAKLEPAEIEAAAFGQSVRHDRITLGALIRTRIAELEQLVQPAGHARTTDHLERPERPSSRIQSSSAGNPKLWSAWRCVM